MGRWWWDSMETEAQYLAAMKQQLMDADELLAHPTQAAFASDAHERHLAGAMYLAGYAVECVLKAYLLRKHRSKLPSYQGFDPTLDDLRKSGVLLPGNLHSLRELWLATGLSGQDQVMELNAGACFAWKPLWRYQPPGNARKNAEDFLQAARDLSNWVEIQP